MTEIFIISLVAFVTAILTFLSGFGLGTILMPVFALFFPVEIAIALTGVVHFTNNLFKFVLIGIKANKSVLIRFGLPAIIASFAGALVLIKVSGLSPLNTYEWMGKTHDITWIKLIISLLLLMLALVEIWPAGKNLSIKGNKQIIGGILSGFFGGLAGIQGAFRSAFLIKSGLSKEAYIATGIIIALLVDVTRLSVYTSSFMTSGLSDNLVLIISATLSAMLGAFIGNKLLKKITYNFIRNMVAIMLILIAMGLGSGVL